MSSNRDLYSRSALRVDISTTALLDFDCTTLSVESDGAIWSKETFDLSKAAQG